MAISQNSLQSYDLKGQKLSFANWISNLSPVDTPFVSMTGKEAINQTKFSWQTDALAPVAGRGSVAENAHAEGEEAVAEQRTATTVLENYTQILRKVVKVSDTANATANYGRGQELQYQMEKAGKELKRDLEVALLTNGAGVGGSGTTANGIRKTSGFASLVAASPTFTGAATHSAFLASGARAPVAESVTGTTPNLGGEVITSIDPDTGAFVRIPAAGANPTEAELFYLTEQLYLSGSDANIIMFHPKHASFFSGLVEKGAGRFRMFDGNDTKFNAYVSTLVDPLGQTYKLIPNRWMPEKSIYVFSASDWTQMVLRAPQRTKLAKDGSYEKWMIEMEVGLRHRNPYASGIIECL